MSTFNASMFESIKSALDNAKNKQGSGVNYKNLLSIAQPGTYLVRLLPNTKSPENTFSHYYHHGWQSIETGQYVSMTSPSTWGERCPISELYFKIIRNTNSSEDELKRAKELLKRKENWMVNVYVINDPNNPDNNGTVKVLRFGRQLDKIIQSAINGDDANEFGMKIFDLSEKGCNLRIKCELVSDNPKAPKYPTYTASRFLSPSSIDGLDASKAEEIYKSIHDLSSFLEHKTVDDIKKFIDEHYYGGQQPTTITTAKVTTPVVDEEEDVPYNPPAKAIVDTPKSEAADPAKDAKIKNLLAGLDDL